MTYDAATMRLGARNYRDVRRARRRNARLREQAQKLREATEAQVNNGRKFLSIERPEDLLQPPAELFPGQEWGLWVLGGAVYEHLAVIGVRNGIVVAQTEDGQLLAVEQGQLLRRGHFLGWVR